VNLAAIREAESMGVLVTIATGRRFRDARPVALELELNAPLISHNGALIKFAHSLETVSASILQSTTISEILRIGREFGADAMLSADPHGKGVLLYDRISEDNLPLQKYLAWSKRLHGEEAHEAVIHVESLQEVAGEYETVHISFSGHCAPMSKLSAVLLDELHITANVIPTIYPLLDFTLLDILPPDISKGNGVERLAKNNQLTAENVLAIGDNFNDLGMLRIAGIGVVMGNAPPELLEDGRFETTLSNDENGVALAIEKFVLTSR